MSQLELDIESALIVETESSDTVGSCINDILTATIRPPQVIIPDFLISGEACMFAALAGAAKTFFSQYMAACAATGTSCLGMPTTAPVPVLYVDSELSRYQIQQRFKLIFEFLGKKPKKGFLKIIHKRSFKGGMPDLTKPEGYEQLQPDINKAKLIILDNLSSLYRTAEELLQNDWNFYNDCLDDLREKDKAVLVLHHTDKKSEYYRGHSEIARAIDTIVIAKKDMRASTVSKTVIKVTKPKSRHKAENSKLIEFSFGDQNGSFSFKRLE